MSKKLLKFLALTMAAMMIFALSGCGGSKNEGESADSQTREQTQSEVKDINTAQAGEKVKLSIMSGARHDMDFMNAAFASFMEKNPDIEIEYQVMTDNYNQVLELAFKTGQAPDIIEVSAWGAYNKAFDMDALEPLNDYMTPEFKAKFGENAFVEGVNMEDGKIYTAKVAGQTSRLIYNKEIMQRVGITELPKTMDEFVEQAKLITEKLKGEGIYGTALNLKNPESGLTRSLNYVAMKSGLSYKGFDFKTGQYDFKPFKPLLQVYKRLFDEKIIFPGSESLDIDPLRSQFANGKIGMYLCWNAFEPNVFKAQFPTNIDWQIGPIPSLKADDNGKLWLDEGRRWAMSSQSEHKKEAWRVLEFLFSDEHLKGYIEAGLGVTSLPSLKDVESEFSKKYPYMKFDEGDAPYPASPNNVKPEGKTYYQVFVDYLLGGVSDLDGALEDLNKRYNAGYEKAIADGAAKKIVIPDFTYEQPIK